MKKRYYIFLTTLLTATLAAAQSPWQWHNPSEEDRWVDSVMATLSLEERIAQLMVVRVPLNLTDAQAAQFSKRMNGLGVGGVCFFVGTAERQVAITRRLQRDARLPLFVCLDAEWGLGMRLKDCFSFPRNARFGQLPPEADTIVYRMGAEIGRQCRMMGIHVNFAPVVDINSNPKNPVIGTRSFGTDRERVAQLGAAFARGHQSQGVMAVAKHYPGHGDTDADSHYELPVINHTPHYIDSIDLHPFKRLIEAGVGGIMTAHLQVNALDPKRPSSLSPVIVDTLLRRTLGFEGLIITDGLDMKGVTNTYGRGLGELAALLAGNDMLLLPPEVEQSVAVIRAAARVSVEVQQRIDYHCRRMLRAKYRHVMPTAHMPIRVPGADRREECEEIVAALNLNTDRRIDSIIAAALEAQAMPGCQLVVLHKGRPLIDRSFGRLTYDSAADPVLPSTLYDLASLTKVCATTLAVMHLVEQGLLSIDDCLSQYLPYLRGTDKERITVKEALSHCARLKAFDAYWRRTADRDSIMQLVAESPLNEKEGYVYSDLGFMLLADVVQFISGMPIDLYVREHFYHPMGLRSIGYMPRETGWTDLWHIAPTEVDTVRGLVWGQVHDPNAWALGGVSGHAGLFANARDVAQLMQMLLNGGVYEGRRYLKAETIALFTRRHFADRKNRRALGFDKQLFTPSPNAQVCPQATQSSYGHTGFTGTMLWVDPDRDLVFVFLSNRVHPSSTPNRLAQMNVRTDLQSIVYEAIGKQQSSAKAGWTSMGSR